MGTLQPIRTQVDLSRLDLTFSPARGAVAGCLSHAGGRREGAIEAAAGTVERTAVRPFFLLVFEVGAPTLLNLDLSVR